MGNVFRSAPDSDVAITNTGSETHSFTVDDLEIDQVLEPGAEMIIDLPGGETIAFYCQFHPDQMFGTITSRELRVQSSYQ